MTPATTVTPFERVQPPPYVPPTGDEPLDAIEEILVGLLVSLAVAELRKECGADPGSDGGSERERE